MEMHCPGCLAAIDGGRAACQMRWDTIMARAYSDPRYGRAYRLAFDTYCMQHPATYCASPRSYAAHLLGLCCGVERAGDPGMYRAIPHWLNGAKTIDKPAVIAPRGRLTVCDLPFDDSPDEHSRRVDSWARDVWDAYAAQHALARQWLDLAASRMRGARHH